MMIRIIFLTVFFLTFSTTFQAQTLTESARTSVLTVGPGQSLNDAFGHNAFRIQDDSLGIDYVFDYGRYDFNAPNFYLKFAQGKLDYLLGLSYYKDFLQSYKTQNRTVKQQWLNLSLKQKQQLFDFLKNNYKPENRAYRYDFFYDNCATKIKDVLNLTTQNQIVFETPKEFTPKSFRTLIQDELEWNSWGSLGIDIALGSVIDKTATAEEHMFLPKYIYAFFEQAVFISGEPLVSHSEVTFQQQTSKKNSFNFLSSPLLILSLFALIVLWITYKDRKNSSVTKWIDIVLALLTGMAGILIVFLWFATDHTATAYNYNLLWAFPLNLILLFQLLKSTPSNWVKPYFKLLIILIALLILHWITGVQHFAPTIIPLLIALLFRYVFWIQILNKNHKNSDNVI